MSSDITLNGITYPANRKVAFPGTDGKEVVFDLPEDADAALSPSSERPVQNKTIYAAVQEIHQHLTSPYNFKGALASASALPAASAANANDTYYLISEQYRVTSNGSSWEQSSMDEGDYTDQLAAAVKRILVTQATAESTYGRMAENLPIQTVAFVSKSWFDDMDGVTGADGHILTVGQAETVGKMQVFITPHSGCNVFVRIKDYSTQAFGSWYPVFRLDTTLAVTGKAADAKAAGDAIEAAKNLALKYQQVTASTAESDYGGLAASLPVRTFSFVARSWFDDMDGTLGSEGYIISLGHSENVGKVQIYLSPYGSSHIYMRAINAGTATPWLTPGKTASGAVYYAYGDSVTRGQIGQWSGEAAFSARGYPYVIARQAEMTLKQKAVAGQGLIKDWDAINASIDSTDLSDAALITVGWAYNDYDEYRSLPMGACSDRTTSTVLGRYHTIMAKLQTKAPMARLVLVTGYGYSDGTVAPQKKPTLAAQFSHSYPFQDGSRTVREFYDELEKMCWLYGWGCVNQAKGCAFNPFNAASVIGDQIHPTDEGYALYGNAIAPRVLAFYGNTRI